jgi:hypothetical protein
VRSGRWQATGDSRTLSSVLNAQVFPLDSCRSRVIMFDCEDQIGELSEIAPER